MIRPVDAEYLGLGIWRYWLTPQILVIETEGDMSPAAVDLWSEATLKAVSDYPSDRPTMYLLQLLAHPNQRLTPYARRKTEDMYKNVVLTRPICIATVLQNTFINQVVSVLVRLLDRSQPLVTQRVFVSSQEALKWLEARANAE